jgi:hypothetical protein
VFGSELFTDCSLSRPFPLSILKEAALAFSAATAATWRSEFLAQLREYVLHQFVLVRSTVDHFSR